MLTRPKFKDYYHVEVVEPKNVFLLTENNYWVLSGQLYQDLVPYLDGRYTVPDIVAALGERVNPTSVFYALHQLEQRGYLIEAEAHFTEEEEAFWQSLRVEAKDAWQRLAHRDVVLTTLGDVRSDDLREALAALRVRVVERDAAASDFYEVVLVTDYLHPDLAAINAAALAEGRPWLLLRLEGEAAWVGPLFQPTTTACWECVADRLRTNRQVDRFILSNTGRTEPLLRPTVGTPLTCRIAVNLAATEIAKWIVTEGSERLTENLLTVDPIQSEIHAHPVVRRPQCPACGDGRQTQPAPRVALESRPKQFVNDGGHRSVTPEETHGRFARHISPITGVINWLVDITGEPNGLTYSYSAGHNFALVQNNLTWLKQNLRSRTSGKGMTNIQAKVSAMGEAIERYSAVWQGDEYHEVGSYEEFAPRALPLEPLLTFSEAQYAERERWNAEATKRNSFHVVPNRFDPTRRIAWTPVWSLTRDEERLVPSSFVYFGHPDTAAHFFCMGNSSGCAAGNNPEEAILQAFLEQVERDACAIWWYNRVQRPAVDVDSFGLSYIADLRDYYAKLNRTFWVVDITSDLGIPTFAALSRREDRPVEDILLGLGCHLDPRIALLRAITEMNQFLPGVMHSKPDGSTIYAFPDGEAIHWWQTATLATQPYLLPHPALPARRQSDFAPLSGPDLRDDVQTCVALAERAGLETFAVNLTRPDIGMSVFRVLVPELRHFWRRLGPGRLFDVPVQQGWLTAPTPEADLNPYSIFF